MNASSNSNDKDFASIDRLWNLITTTNLPNVRIPTENQSEVESKRRWVACCESLTCLFSKYDGESKVERCFEVPSDFEYFISTYGGGLSLGSFDFFMPDTISTLARQDAEAIEEDQKNGWPPVMNRSVVDGYWIRVGGPESKYDHFLCCDREHSRFGTYTRGDDSHPHWDGDYESHSTFVNLLTDLVRQCVNNIPPTFFNETFDEPMNGQLGMQLRLNGFDSFWQFIDQHGFTTTKKLADQLGLDYAGFEDLAVFFSFSPASRHATSFCIVAAELLNGSRVHYIGHDSDAFFLITRPTTQLADECAYLDWAAEASIEIGKYLSENMEHFAAPIQYNSPWLIAIVDRTLRR